MTKLDQFQSVFLAADKTVLHYEKLAVERVLVVSDLDGDAAGELLNRVRGDDNPDAYLLLSFVENWRGNHEKSIELARKALSLSPSMADAWGQLGISLNSAGRPKEAIPVLENAMRLSPYYATYILLQFAKAQRHTGRHEDAILANRKLICRSPELTFAYRGAALSYGALGRDEEARSAIAELLKIQPDYSLQDYIDDGDSGLGPEVRVRNIEILRRHNISWIILQSSQIR